MARQVRDILGDLDRLDFAGDYMARLYEVCDELEDAPDSATAVEPVLRFIERNAERDLGAPGPLVHFIETVSGYEEALLQSLQRLPTDLTVWMLNRILNVAEDEQRSRYLELMRSIAGDSAVNRDARDAALSFLRHQAAS